MNIQVGKNIKKLREEKGLSQEAMADYLHISQSSYSRMEAGECNTWVNHIATLSDFFQIQPEDLLKTENTIIGNIGTNHGVGYAEIVNQLSERLIDQYEQRLSEKDQIINELKNFIDKKNK